MRYALEKRTGKTFDAESDVCPAYGRYECITCSARVHLRTGDVRVHHFAHNPNEGSEDCENYHPGIYAPGSPGSSRSGPAASRILVSLYMRVPNWTERRAFWQLEVLIPPTVEVAGEVIVQDGLSGRRRIPASDLVGSGLKVAVRTKAEPYCLRTVGMTDAQFINRLTEPVSGLGKTVPSVFKYSKNSGRRLVDPREPLYWGRGYYIVHHQDLPIVIPTGIQESPLRTNGEWRASVIQLPDDEHDGFRSWVAQHLDRTIEVPPVRLDVIAPPVDASDDDSIGVALGQEVILSVTGEPGSKPPAELCVRLAGDVEPKRVPLPQTLPALVSLGELADGMTEAYLPNEWAAEVTFFLVAGPAGREPPAAALVIASQDLESSVPFHSRKTSDALRAIRNSRLEIKTLRLPKRLAVRITTKKSDSLGRLGKEVILQPDIPDESGAGLNWHSAFEERVSALLRKHLTKDHIDLQVDLGNFGRASTFAQKSAEKGGTHFTLPESVCRTARWILAMTRDAQTRAFGSVTRDGIAFLDRLLKSQSRTRLGTEDARLLHCLVECRSIPSTLEPQMRALTRQVLIHVGAARDPGHTLEH